jgi:hypothetical protein
MANIINTNIEGIVIEPVSFKEASADAGLSPVWSSYRVGLAEHKQKQKAQHTQRYFVLIVVAGVMAFVLTR